MGANAGLILTFLFGLLDRAQAIAQLLKTARAENRDITDAELDALALDDDAARAELVAANKRRGTA